MVTLGAMKGIGYFQKRIGIFFGISFGIFLLDFFFGFLWIFSSYLNMEGIDLFVKILGWCRTKEGHEFRSLEVREASSSHLKTREIVDHIEMYTLVHPFNSRWRWCCGLFNFKGLYSSSKIEKTQNEHPNLIIVCQNLNCL